jgi:hypothetical protein
MKNISDKSCRENKNTLFMLSVFFPLSENRTLREIMWKNIVQPDRLSNNLELHRKDPHCM